MVDHLYLVLIGCIQLIEACLHTLLVGKRLNCCAQGRHQKLSFRYTSIGPIQKGAMWPHFALQQCWRATWLATYIIHGNGYVQMIFFFLMLYLAIFCQITNLYFISVMYLLHYHWNKTLQTILFKLCDVYFFLCRFPFLH